MSRAAIVGRFGTAAAASFSTAAVAILSVLAAAAPGTALAQPQQPTAAAPVVIDGPGSDIAGLSGMSVAKDGTGGLVYLKRVSGVAHVFVSRLVGGVFGTPELVDGGLATASSQPVIAAGNGGLLLVAFVNAGTLYVVDRLASTAAPTAPQPLAGAASNPAISISNFGKAYLAFTAAGVGGNDVRVAYYFAGHWTVVPSPLDAVASEDAGTGSGRPAVTAAGDGVGIIAWGEAGHIYSRRVWGTAPSIVFEQADPPTLSGWDEISADRPTIGTGGDSSYATVAFQERFSSGGQTQARVLMRRLHGSQYDPSVAQADGLTTPASEGAVQPGVVASEFGRGFVTSARDGSNALYAMRTVANDAAGSITRVDSLPNASPPDAVASMAGLTSDLIAWQEDPGAPRASEIRLRYAPDGVNLGPELVLSSRAQGPTDAGSGLAAAGDGDGDAVVAWAQGDPASPAIVAAQLYEAPGPFAAATRFAYSRSSQPLLSWSPAHELWGPLRYTVVLDGAALAPTTATSLRAPEPLADGPHVWQVVATNPAGLTSTMKPASVWVDVVAPVGQLALRGRRQVGATLHLSVTYTDAPAPEPPTSASGIAGVTVNFGDRTVAHIRHGVLHAYRRAGRFRMTVTITDKAGNVTKLVQLVEIKPKPKPQPRRKRQNRKPKKR